MSIMVPTTQWLRILAEQKAANKENVPPGTVFSGVSGREYELEVDVQFDNTRENYPLILTDTNGTFGFMGMGPIYGDDRGKITFFVSKTGKGPHGRGIIGANHTGGCLVSNTALVPRKWYRVFVQKTLDETSLSITTDGVTDTVWCGKLDPAPDGFVTPASGPIAVGKISGGIKNVWIFDGSSPPPKEEEEEEAAAPDTGYIYIYIYI